MTFPFATIYKKTRKGATQQWSQEIDGSKYRTISGQVGGKLITTEWTQCIATNEGRSNERSPEQQALFEVAANRKKKLDKDYHENIDNIDEGSKIFEPMLAESYKDRIKKKVSKTQPEFKYTDIFSQPKLNGMRCIIKSDGMWSRKGKPIVSCPHIFEVLKHIFVEYPDLVLDGELYNHDLKDDFDELMSIFKQLKPTAEDLEKSREFGQFHIYDVTTQNDSEYEIGSEILFANSNYSTRLKIFEYVKKSNAIYIIKTTAVTSLYHLDQLYKEYLADGYEGQMIRADTPYENFRTWNLLKHKEFQSAEFELVDIVSGIGNWTGKAKSAKLRMLDGREFDAGITGNMAFCKKLLKDKAKYIGRPTTVDFFQYTPGGIPLFPRCKEFDRMDI